MSGEALWNRIIAFLPLSGEEMQTTTGLWFKASSNDGRYDVPLQSYSVRDARNTLCSLTETMVINR